MTIKKIVEAYIHENCLTLESVKRVYKVLSEVLEKVPDEIVLGCLKKGADSVIFEEGELCFHNSKKNTVFVEKVPVNVDRLMSIQGMQYVQSVKLDFASYELQFILNVRALDNADERIKKAYLAEMKKWDTGAVAEDNFFFVPVELIENL